LVRYAMAAFFLLLDLLRQEKSLLLDLPSLALVMARAGPCPRH
jgi:hypothetical protein